MGLGGCFCIRSVPFCKVGKSKPKATIKHVHVKHLGRPEIQKYSGSLFSKHIGIQEIDLSGVALGADCQLVARYLLGLTSAGQPSGNSDLMVLNLQRCGIQPKGAVALSRALELSEIKYLNILGSELLPTLLSLAL